MTERAVIDRVEDGLAVLLVGTDEKEVVVRLRDLPEGSGPGVWLRVNLDGERLTHAEVDSETTRVRKSRIQQTLNRLLGRGQGA